MKKQALKFSSQRLEFFAITIDDAEKIVSWRSNTEIINYFLNPSPTTMAQHLNWFEKYTQDDRRFDFIIYCKADNAPIGVVDFSLLDKNCAEIGYYIAEPDYRRKGYAKEAVAALIDFAKEQFKITLFKAEIHKENTASIRLIKSLGFECNDTEKFATYYFACT